MARQKKYSEIHTVTFRYIGTDKEFDFFLKSIVYDYLTFINTNTNIKVSKTFHLPIAL